MNASEIQLKMIDEIRLIPQDRLSRLYDLIHFYRLGLEANQNNSAEIMQFAGCWEDMPNEEFENFINEISERRKQTLSRRRNYETFAN